MEKFDLIVIGGGPAGYVGAIRAAQRGMSVACIEKDKSLGGTCLNVGCIPSKALLYSSECFHQLQAKGKEHGIECENLRVNLTQMMERKKSIVSTLTGGIDFLFKKNKITRIQGVATLASPHTVSVKTEQGEQFLEGRHILLASGSEPIALPFLPFDESNVLSSTGALSLDQIPKKLLMVGAGVIGLELGSVYRRLGSEVEVVELLDRAVPTMDLEVSKNVLAIFKKQGIGFHLSTKVVDAKVEKNGVSLTTEDETGKQRLLSGDCVLVAIGRRPFVEGLGLEQVGIAQDSRGGIQINDHFQTNIASIYAVGDVVEGAMLAHKASEEAIVAVDIMCGHFEPIEYVSIPNVMYTTPEVACVGLSEEEAKQHGLTVCVGKAPFKANSRARTSGEDEGFVKVIGDKATDRILGMHIIGPHASEMIGEGVLALTNKMTVKELAEASHAHPTCSESIKEAALACQKMAIHF